jgi:hypothetical protein
MKPRRTTLSIHVLLGSVATAMVLFSAPAASPGVIYKTGFEKNDFGLGPLVGQQGFEEWDGRSEPAVVQIGEATAGKQAVMIDGRLANDFDPVSDMAWEYYFFHGPSYGYDVAAAKASVVTFKCDLMLRNLGDTADDWIGLAIYTESGIRVAYMTLETGGIFWFENGWYSPGPPVFILDGAEFDKYYSVKLEYDFAAGVARYWLNSKLVYTSEPTLEPDMIDWVLGDVDMIVGSYDRTRPAHVIGFFDNYEIKVSGRNTAK